MFKVVIIAWVEKEPVNVELYIVDSLQNMWLTNDIYGYHGINGTFHHMASYKTNQLMYGGRCAMGYISLSNADSSPLGFTPRSAIITASIYLIAHFPPYIKGARSLLIFIRRSVLVNIIMRL